MVKLSKILLLGLKLCLVLGCIACNAQPAPTPVPTTVIATPAATATESTAKKLDIPSINLFLDVTWYQTTLVKTSDLWFSGHGELSPRF